MKSLTARLTLGYALVVTLTVALLLIIGRYYMVYTYVQGVDLLNDAEFHEIGDRLNSLDNLKDKAVIIDAIREHTEIDAALFYFQVGYGHEAVFFQSANLGKHFLPNNIHRQQHITVDSPELGKLRISEYKLHGLDVHIASSLQPVEQLNQRFAKASLPVLLIVFIGSLCFGYAMSRLALNPVRSIQRTAQRITAENLSERISTSDNDDEFSQLARLLNQMFDRLEASFQQVHRFTSDASHELRTPLSLIRLHAEKLADYKSLAEEECNKATTELLAEIDHLNKLIDDLLFLARADAGVLKLNKSDHNLHEFLKDFAEDAAALSEQSGLQFTLKLECNARYTFDPIWIRQALLNVLSNAIKFSPVEGAIHFTVRQESQWLVFTMSDQGPGVPNDQLGKIFHRFYRYRADNRNDTSGSGLGLAICASIITQHGGRVEARNGTPGPGLEVILYLPITT